MREVGRLAVRGVQVGADAGIEAVDRRLLVRTRQRDEDRVVGGRRVDLIPERVEQQLPERVVVDVELEVDAVVQTHHRLGLRFRRRRRPAVGLVGGDRRRPFFVELPVLGIVAVGVDSIARRDHVVAVVVAEVLPPQAVVVERVLVPVGVGHDHEPDLGGRQQVDDVGLAFPVHLDQVLEQPAVDLDADPLQRVLERAVQRRRAGVVGHGVGVGGELEGDDVARRVGAVTFRIGAPGLPEHLELQQVGIGGGDLAEVGADAVRAVVGTEHLEPGVLLLLGELGRGHTLGVGPERQVDSLLLEPLALPWIEHEHDADAALHLVDRDDVVAVIGEPSGGCAVDDGLVHLQAGIRRLLGVTLPIVLRDHRPAQREQRAGNDGDQDPTVHSHGTPLVPQRPRPVVAGARDWDDGRASLSHRQGRDHGPVDDWCLSAAGFSASVCHASTGSGERCASARTR